MYTQGVCRVVRVELTFTYCDCSLHDAGVMSELQMYTWEPSVRCSQMYSFSALDRGLENPGKCMVMESDKKYTVCPSNAYSTL